MTVEELRQMLLELDTAGCMYRLDDKKEKVERINTAFYRRCIRNATITEVRPEIPYFIHNGNPYLNGIREKDWRKRIPSHLKDSNDKLYKVNKAFFCVLDPKDVNERIKSRWPYVDAEGLISMVIRDNCYEKADTIGRLKAVIKDRCIKNPYTIISLDDCDVVTKFTKNTNHSNALTNQRMFEQFVLPNIQPIVKKYGLRIDKDTRKLYATNEMVRFLDKIVDDKITQCIDELEKAGIKISPHKYYTRADVCGDVGLVLRQNYIKKDS